MSRLSAYLGAFALSFGMIAAGFIGSSPIPHPVPPRAASPEPLNLQVASWYGAPYHGRKTASGEVYDQEAMTAAHPFHPFGTLLRCELAGRSVVVRVTDRGPFIAGRDLDLSRAAARQLGMLDAGVAVINVRRVE